MELDDDFRFGAGGMCCGKPVGCNMPIEGCRYKLLRSDDPRLRCQATSWPESATPEGYCVPIDKLTMWQCTLPKGHAEGHASEPIGVDRPTIKLLASAGADQHE